MILVIAAAEQAGSTNNTAVTVAIIMAVASFFGTAIGGWYTFRAARRNAETTREVENDRLSSEQVKAWREDVQTLRQQRAEDSEKIRNLEKRLEEVVQAHERDRTEHRQQRQVLEGRIDALVYWGRAVVRIMREQGMSFPPPPPGVNDQT